MCFKSKTMLPRFLVLLLIRWVNLVKWHCSFLSLIFLMYKADATMITYQFSSGQLLSRVRLFVTPWTAARQASLFITNSSILLKLMSVESVMLSNHLILCHPLLLLSSIFPSIRVFSSDTAVCIRWAKYWSFSFSISPSNEHPGLIFSMDWLDLFAVRGTLKSLLQHHSSKASILWLLSFLYSPTLTSIHDYWKNHILD